MRSIPVTEFKSHCLSLLEQVKRSGESIEVTKHGRPLATVSPPLPPAEFDYSPGAFKDTAWEVEDIMVDLAELGVEWDALKGSSPLATLDGRLRSLPWLATIG